MGRQASRATITRQTSKAALKREKSKKEFKKEKSKKELKKEKSQKGLKKEKSQKGLKKEKSKKGLQKEKSKKKLKKEKSKKALAKQPSQANFSSQPSRDSLNPTPSRGNLQKTKSQQSFKTRPSPSLSRAESNRQIAGRRGWREKFKKVEEKPKRGLVVIWLVVGAELSFDLGQTIIAFRAMLEEGDCCGYELNLGPLPLTVATPFIFLVCLELVVLFRAVTISLWPSILDKTTSSPDGEGGSGRLGWALSCCNCFKWSVKTLLKFINVLVLLNPFFGCIIAWILLYQSDKSESFMVLGLEGGSIILHFISVKLEGSVQTFCGFLTHCIPLIPFIASISLTLFYLKQEGICYIVEQSLFAFQGCEICPNNFPPIEGNCLINGTNVTIADGGFLNLGDIDNLDNLNGLTSSTAQQETFCGDTHEGWNTNFCFFGYKED